MRDSKFGKALVIETSETGGSYILGFRIDPKEKLMGTYKTLLSIQEAFLQHPIYGVDFNPDVIKSFPLQKVFVNNASLIKLFKIAEFGSRK